jgi:integrase
MVVDLTGVNTVRKTLNDGTVKVYRYLGKGGEPLVGEPGTPEFDQSVERAILSESGEGVGAKTLGHVIDLYQDSQDFLTNIGKTTQGDYRRKTRVIQERFGSSPLAALVDPAIRGVFLQWRDQLAKGDPRSNHPFFCKPSLSRAHSTFKVLRLVIGWAVYRGMIAVNPCLDSRRIYHGTTVDKIWSFEQEAEFFAKVPPRFWIAVVLAVWTGQREGSLVALRWSDYDGENLRCQVTKRRIIDPPKWITVPCGAPLKAALNALKRQTAVRPWEEKERAIIESAYGEPWAHAKSFGVSLSRACKRGGFVHDLHFHDLRGTAVTRLAISGCTEFEIASITGHSVGRVRSILEIHYMHYNLEIRQNAIRKLEEHYGALAGRFPNFRPTTVPLGTPSR